MSESAESVASIEPVAAVRFPKPRKGRFGRKDEPIFANRLSFSFSGKVNPPSFSFFLKMFVNTFLKLPEEVGNRGLSALSKVNDGRLEDLGDGEVVKDERGRLEKRDDTELDVEWLDRGD